MTNFQSLVKESKLSLKELSKETGISYSTLGNYNQGSRIPNAKNAQILSEYFDVSIPYLLELDPNRKLEDPSDIKEVIKAFGKVFQGKSTIQNKINEWTPFGNDLAFILAELNHSEDLADYIDFKASKNDFNPILVTAIKDFIADEKMGLIPFLINKSGGKDSPYQYVWQEWIKTEEYQKKFPKNNNK